MRNFSKTLISMAAVMAVGSAMAAGAMAATLSATYSNGTVSIGNVTTGKDQYTLLIVQGEKAAGSTDYSYYAKNTTIKQIDQNDAGVPFTSTTVGTLDEGSYKVLVGNNDGSVDTGYFTVGGTDEPEVPPVVTEEIVIGDVTGDSKVTAPDYSAVLTYVKKRKQDAVSTSTTYTANTFNKRKTADGSEVVIGDVTGDSKVTAPDYSALLTYVKKRKQNTDSTSTTYTANTLNTVSVVVE